MSAPSWPRLAGWLAMAAPGSLEGSWLRIDDGVSKAGRFALREDGAHIAIDDKGQLSHSFSLNSLLWNDIDRTNDDYHRAVGPIRPVDHDGRDCWQVQLEPPARKSGMLTLVVDEATGLCLRQSNEEFGYVQEVTNLRLDVVIADAVFAPLRQREATQAQDRALSELFMARPAPTPRWFPWRSTYVASAECVEVWGSHGEGSVGRAPVGTPAPIGDDFMRDRTIHRLLRTRLVVGRRHECAHHRGGRAGGCRPRRDAGRGRGARKGLTACHRADDQQRLGPRAMTCSGRGASGSSCDRSRSQAKNRTKARRLPELWSRMAPRSGG